MHPDCYQVYREGKNGKVERVAPEEGARILGRQSHTENVSDTDPKEKFVNGKQIPESGAYQLRADAVIMFSLLVVLVMYFLTSVTLLPVEYKWNEILSSFPYSLFSWRSLAWLRSDYIILWSKGINMMFVLLTMITLFHSVNEFFEYTHLDKELSANERQFGIFAALALALGTNCWFIISNPLLYSECGLIVFLVALNNLLLMKLIYSEGNSKSCVAAVLSALLSVVIIVLEPMCVIFLLCSAITLMYVDSRQDTSFRISFSFLGTVGAVLSCFVIILRIYRDIVPSNENIVLVGDISSEIEAAGLLSVLWCICEGSVGVILSPGRGILVMSPFLGVSLISGIYILYNSYRQQQPKNEKSFCLITALCCGSIFYVFCYVVSQCATMEYLYVENIAPWNGWWGGHQISNVYLVVILPSLILLLPTIFLLPLSWKKFAFYSVVVFIGFSILVHTIGSFSGANHAVFAWNTKETYYCYAEDPTSTPSTDPFLILSNAEHELARALSSRILVSHVAENINYAAHRGRLWHLNALPYWQFLFGSVNNQDLEFRQIHIEEELDEFCLHEFHHQLRSEEEKLRQEIHNLKRTPNQERYLINEPTETPASPLVEILEQKEENYEADSMENKCGPKRSIAMPIINFLYIGADGRYNLGDEMNVEKFLTATSKIFQERGLGVRVTAIRTFPTADPVLSPCNSVRYQKLDWNEIDVIVLGAGSTIRDQYLCQLSLTELRDHPTIPVLLWGSGFDDLLLLTSNRNIMRQLRASDFSAISFLSTSKLVHSVNLLSSHPQIFGGVRGNYTQLFTERMLQEHPNQSISFTALGEPGLLPSAPTTPSQRFLNWTKPTKKYIMVNFGMPTEGETHMYGQSQQSVGAALDLLVKELARNFQVVLYATHTSDIKHIQSLQQIVISMGVPESQILLLPFVADDTELVMLLESASLSITFRYYAAVLSAYAQVPFVALAYRFKTIEFCDSIDRSEFVLPTDRLDYPSLKALVDKALQERTHDKNNSSNALQTLKLSIAHNYETSLSDLCDYLQTFPHRSTDLSIKDLKPKRILYIGNIMTMNDRFRFQTLSTSFIHYFQMNYDIYITMEQMNPHHPSIQQWEKPLHTYATIVLAGFSFPHPLLSHLLEKIPESVPILLAGCFPSSSSKIHSIPAKKAWEDSYQRPVTSIEYPSLLLPVVREQNSERRQIGVFLSEIQSDFPYSEVSDSLRMLSKALQALTEEYEIVIFTTEEVSLQDIDTINTSMSMSIQGREALKHVQIIRQLWEVSLVENLIATLKLVFTFSDFSSELCTRNETPFLQIISGGLPSLFLEEIGLGTLSVDLRQIRTHNTLLEHTFPLLASTESTIQDIKEKKGRLESKQNVVIKQALPSTVS